MGSMSRDNTSKYIPGVCNIGDADIRRRRRIGWTWALTALVILVVLLIPSVPKGWRLILIFPVMVSATGFIQARMHFCAYFAMLGLFNFGNAGKFDTVQQAEFRAKDRRKAMQIIFYAATTAIVIGVAAFLLPI